MSAQPYNIRLRFPTRKSLTLGGETVRFGLGKGLRKLGECNTPGKDVDSIMPIRQRARVMISSSSMSPTAITRLSSRQASTRIRRLPSCRLLLMSRQLRRRRLMQRRNKKVVEPEVRLVAQLAVR